MVFRRLMAVSIIIMLIITIFVIHDGKAQEAKQDSTVQSKDQIKIVDPSTFTKPTDLKSMWDLTKYGGVFRYFIIGVFVLGMMTIIYKFSELFLDSQHAQNLERLNLRKVTLVDVMRVIKTNKGSMLSGLFKYMLDLYQTRKSAEGFSDEIIDFVQIQQDRFQAFQSRMAFFSDTAGALGLLGTVWGMFVTFFGGDFDKHKILSGMGVALITTLMGLVVSIFLNLFTTQTHGYFRKRIDKVTDLGNQFRLRLHQLEQSLDNSISDFNNDSASGTVKGKQDYELSKAVIEAVDRQLKRSDPIFDFNEDSKQLLDSTNNKYKFTMISGDNQSGEVNTRLQQPFIIQLSNSDGNGLSDKTLIFEIIEGNGKLANGRKQHELQTDASGLAQSHLILGSIAGENLVRVKLKDNEKVDLKFRAWGKPTEPDRMVYVSGNHQNSPCGQELKEPFIAKVIDKFDNPIPDWPVTYKVVNGKGFFPEKKSSVLTSTDKDGIVEVYYTLGKRPGFNAVSACAKGLKRTRLQFEALGQG